MSGDSFPPGSIANVAGTRALVEPPPDEPGGLVEPPPDEPGGLVEPRVDPVDAVVVGRDGVGFEVLLPAV